MPGLGAWLLALIPALVTRVLLSLGITIVTLVGVDAAITELLENFEEQMNLLPVAWLQLFVISGIKQGLGIVVGAMLMKLSMWTFLTGTKMVMRNL